MEDAGDFGDFGEATDLNDVPNEHNYPSEYHASSN